MSTSMPEFEVIKRSIRQRHIEQLRDLNIVADSFEVFPTGTSYDDIVRWSQESEEQLHAGKSQRVYGGPFGSPLNFNNAFLAFMESTAMYLRDKSSIVKAFDATYSDYDNEAALKLFEKSTAHIDALADKWGMQFIQICDFVTLHPDGKKWIVGPFCGAFFPKNFAGANPFIGVAFKGTTTTSESINDWTSMSTVMAVDCLWGSQVASGFYYPIFSTYPQAASKKPFLMIQQAIQEIASLATAPVITHVTGHSLGGAFASLCFAELSIKGYGTQLATLGDLYTFGAPRAGRGDFAKPLLAAVRPPKNIGSSWRIVNNKDYVPKVPVSPPFSKDPFIHVNAACKIFPDKKPEAEPSEIDTHPRWSLPTAISPHYTPEYYKSLTYASTGHPVKESFKTLSIYPAFDISSDVAIMSSLDINVSKPVEVSLETYLDNTIGTIKCGNCFGEITLRGVIGKLDLGRKQSFSYRDDESWKYLYSKGSQCLFSRDESDRSTWKIQFVVDEICVATAFVSTNSIIDNSGPLRGSCVWTFLEGPKIDEISSQIADAVASIFH